MGRLGDAAKGEFQIQGLADDIHHALAGRRRLVVGLRVPDVMADLALTPGHQVELAAGGMAADVDQLFVGHGMTAVTVGRDLIEPHRPDHAGGLGLGVAGLLVIRFFAFHGHALAAVIAVFLDPVLAGAVARFTRDPGDGLDLSLHLGRREMAAQAVAIGLHAADAQVLGDLLGFLLARQLLEGDRVPGLFPNRDGGLVTFAAGVGTGDVGGVQLQFPGRGRVPGCHHRHRNHKAQGRIRGAGAKYSVQKFLHHGHPR